MSYSTREKADMHLVYGMAGMNSRLAERMYAQMYPNRSHPSRGTFVQLHANLAAYGSFQSPLDRVRPVTDRLEEEILDEVENNPSTSTRAVAHRLHTNSSTVWNVLNRQLLYPYHLQKVQVLHPTDPPLRVDFCLWVLRRYRTDRDLHQKNVFTDESSFTRDGIFNTKNSHVWDEENPFAVVERGHQIRFKVNVWAGVIGDTLIGPYILPTNLNGRSYLTFLREVLPVLLEDLPLQLRQNMLFQHDGCPAHYTLPVRQHLNVTYPARWIGRGGPIPWPARSPDLTPLDYFLWGRLKSLVYDNTKITSELDLLGRISAAVAEIKSEEIKKANKQIIKRSKLCIREGGKNFEQLMKKN